MVTVAVFDSGLGSLSIIEPIRHKINAEIIYFADSINFPYGNKSAAELDRIIRGSIEMLRNEFLPDMIVMASNTPSIILDIDEPDVIGVRPPISHACDISKTRHIGLLGTRSLVYSNNLNQYIKYNIPDDSFHIHPIDATRMIDLVESGKFLTDNKYCTRVIYDTLDNIDNIDTITLSSTHLPFLRSILNDTIHDVQFIDPGDMVAQHISDIIPDIIPHNTSQSSLDIFTSDDPERLQDVLGKLGIHETVNLLSL